MLIVVKDRSILQSNASIARAQRHRAAVHRSVWLACMLGGVAESAYSDSAMTIQAADTAPPAYQWQAVLDGELWHSLRADLPGRTHLLTHGLASVAVEGGAAFALPQLQLYGATLFTNGRAVNRDGVASIQGISNIEAPSGLRLYELWAEWQFSGQHSLRAGLYDVNSEFDTMATASLFINPSHGTGPDLSQSGRNGPSIFPVTSLALRSVHHFGPWTVQIAALDGVPGDPAHPSRTSIQFNHNDGLLWLAEAAWASDAGVKAAMGYWRYSADFEDLTAVNPDGTPVRRNDNQGYYGLIDAPLRTAETGYPAIRGYVRAGSANPHLNATRTYIGAGVAISGLRAAHDDQLGLALGVARASDAFRDAQAADGQATSRQERILELTYLLPLTPWFSLQPDIQQVQHAGFSSELPETWIFGLRFELLFTAPR